MQKAKLGISQKVFAQLERIFNKTATQSYPIVFNGFSHPLEAPQISPYHFDLGISIQASIDQLTPYHPTLSHEISSNTNLSTGIHELRFWVQPVTVYTISEITAFNPVTTAIPFEISTVPKITHLTCQISPKFLRTNPIDLLAFSKSPLTHVIGIKASQFKIHQSEQIPSQIPVIRFPMNPQWIPKAELRICWRKAVLRTKRSPQDLNMLGFFPGVPISRIKQIEFSHSPVQLKYWLLDTPRKKSESTSLSLFHNVLDNIFFLTSSQNE